jgi:serine protease Do
LNADTISPELANLFDIPKEMEQGVVVTGIKKNSDAVEKDVRQGDLITRVNQDPVANVDEFEKKIEAARKTRASVALFVYRNGVSFYLAVRVKKGEGTTGKSTTPK